MIAIDAFTSQAAIKKCSYSSIGISGCAGNDPDPGFLQRGHRAGSKAAADKHIDTISSQNHSQRLMHYAICAHNFCMEHSAAICIIDLELLRSSEMLEDTAVFIGYCDSHLLIVSFVNLFRNNRSEILYRILSVK